MNRIGITAACLCLDLWAAWTSASGPSEDERTHYPTFGIAFRQPKGWIEQMRDKSEDCRMVDQPGLYAKEARGSHHG
jgi:hypothetical protein